MNITKYRKTSFFGTKIVMKLNDFFWPTKKVAWYVVLLESASLSPHSWYFLCHAGCKLHLNALMMRCFWYSIRLQIWQWTISIFFQYIKSLLISILYQSLLTYDFWLGLGNYAWLISFLKLRKVRCDCVI